MRRELLQQTLSNLQNQLSLSEADELSGADVQALWMSLATTILAATGGQGECRRVKPYSDLRPVIDHDGTFKWCCNHDPEHCAR
jgi:hypothetical protein